MRTILNSIVFIIIGSVFLNPVLSLLNYYSCRVRYSQRIYSLERECHWSYEVMADAINNFATLITVFHVVFILGTTWALWTFIRERNQEINKKSAIVADKDE